MFTVNSDAFIQPPSMAGSIN